MIKEVHICLFVLNFSHKYSSQASYVTSFLRKQMNHSTTKQWMSYLEAYLFHRTHEQHQHPSWQYGGAVVKSLSFAYFQTKILMKVSDLPISMISPVQSKIFQDVPQVPKLEYYETFVQFIQW